MKDYLSGVRLLGRGIAMYARNPALVGLGFVPAMISGTLFLFAFATLIYFATDLAELVTWFADGWNSWLRNTVRTGATLGIIGLGGFLGMLTFTAVTLTIGDPFYERISQRVEAGFGGVPDEVEVPWYRSLRRSIADSARLLLVSLSIGIPLFFAGLVPVLGQTAVPVLAAAVGGWFLAVELTGAPFGRRGLRLPQRRAMLRAHRPLTLGFGMAVFVCFLVPFGAILIMPAAVVGGTLLARQVLGLPIEAT
jgi:CysZ protein